eukprot:gb/GEZN01006960.1/.p1 GENE.gb/GEZN01006960.1/~~gb/GEZN01006960.1/.p1  ORF type:complete len:378 (+),score=72.82 gb/GEZN01006960.1/:64-1197(+)
MSQSSVQVFTVDAFTDSAFGGNPAAVVLLPPGPGPNVAWMQNVAAEMNLSETAFVLLLNTSSPSQGCVFSLRWFTPQKEIDLCGHATLAAAHILYQQNKVPREKDIIFRTKFKGDLRARFGGSTQRKKQEEGKEDQAKPTKQQEEKDEQAMITLSFPQEAPQQLGVTDSDSLLKVGAIVGALLDKPHAPFKETCRELGLKWMGAHDQRIFLRLDDPAVLLRVAPNFPLLAKVDCRGVCVTAPGQSDAPQEVGSQLDTQIKNLERYDFVSRFFATYVGINEDPVTGSTHCSLAPLWAQISGKTEFLAYQASKRGGVLHVKMVKEEGQDKVELRGQAFTVTQGLFSEEAVKLAWSGQEEEREVLKLQEGVSKKRRNPTE